LDKLVLVAVPQCRRPPAASTCLAAEEQGGPMKVAAGALLFAALTGAAATRAGASTFIPMSVENLTRSSVAVVTARVPATRGVLSANGTVNPLVALAVEEILHGALPASAVTLKEPGGKAAGVEEAIDGAPQYVVGERVVVFLGVRPDGSLRTNQLALGKFS